MSPSNTNRYFCLGAMAAITFICVGYWGVWLWLGWSAIMMFVQGEMP